MTALHLAFNHYMTEKGSMPATVLAAIGTLITGYIGAREWLKNAPNSYERFVSGVATTED